MLAQLTVWLATGVAFAAYAEPGAVPPPPAADEGSKAEVPAAPASLAQIEEWIGQLSSDTYAVREAATRHLTAAGKEAIPRLIEVGLGKDLEVTSRVVRILSALYRASDEATVDAAEAGLEQLLAAPNRPSAAQRADAVFSANANLRQERALAQIERLGGKVSYHRNPLEEDDKPGTPENARKKSISHIVLNRNWKGGNEGLMYLKRLGAQRWALFITTAAPVTEAGLTELRQALPELAIQIRGEACLGVRSMVAPGQPGVQVFEVEKSSAADKAGIESGDIILKFDGQEVDFDAMINIIKMKNAGDKVVVELLRGGQMIKKDVTLEEWK